VENTTYVLPFAPDLEYWTEEHYQIYSLIETTLGYRKEVTKEQAEQQEKADKVEQMMLTGEGDWRSLLDDIVESGEDLSEVDYTDMIRKIEAEESM
jgi:hypothetical protein